MDYHLSDPELDSSETEKYYSEKTLYLPSCYWCYRPGGMAPDVAKSPCVGNGFITFGSLANFSKISLPAQKLWAQILNQVKDSRLLLHAQPGKYLDEFRKRFADWGISADRLEFIPKQPWADYMRTYDRIDIALDPFPHGGAITSCDALWMGVPVVTLSGRLPMGRVGKSILQNIGLPELIAQNPQEYVAIAARLANDRTRLGELRKGMRERMAHSPLMNAAQFTKDLESAYRKAWTTWATA
jgi:predicted O-linked N-acetylglucosamine transferase (SPINDLY family)